MRPSNATGCDCGGVGVCPACLREERDQYRQAALEMHAEIRNGLAWIGSGCEPSVAHSAMLKTADKWRGLLGEDD